MLTPLVEQIRVPRLGPGRARTRPDELLGDKAYSSRAIRTYLRERGITATIAEPDDQKRHRRNRGTKGGRPPKFNAQRYKGRNIIERGFCHLKQWRGIATRYDKLATTYRAAALLHGVTAWTKHLSDTLQFRSRAMARELRRHDMVGSMGRVGAAGDNAAMESFWSLLQTNVLNQQRWATRQELRLAIVVWIERKYHRQRAQDTLGGLTPIEFEAKLAEPHTLAA